MSRQNTFIENYVFVQLKVMIFMVLVSLAIQLGFVTLIFE